MEKKIFIFDEVYLEPAARSQAESEKSGIFGMAARLKVWDLPKDADISLVSSEKRYEPFWNIKAERNVVFQKNENYVITAMDKRSARQISLLGQKFELPATRVITIPGIEHCEKYNAISEYFDGLKRKAPQKELAEYATRFSTHELAEDEALGLIAPENTAAYLLQDVRARLMEPIQADEILDDVFHVEALTLYYRPVYAFEFSWREKRGVVEIDALTGTVNREGNMLGSMTKKLASRDALFDVGAELANALVPGGGVMVKIVGNLTKQD